MARAKRRTLCVRPLTKGRWPFALLGLAAAATITLGASRLESPWFTAAAGTLSEVAEQLAPTAAPEHEGTPTDRAPFNVRSVVASAETEPVPHDGDAADDPAIWVHPVDPSRSTIIGTDKLGGIAVYDLSGRQLQYLPDGAMNNVDLRDSFPLGGDHVSLVTAGNRSSDTIAAYRIDPNSRLLVDVTARPIRTGLEVYGSCMYRSPTTGRFYVFVTSKDGDVEQWHLFDSGSGKVEAALVRRLSLDSIAEACAADDDLARLYVTEELRGLWRFDAEPSGAATRVLVDTANRDGRLVPELEGITIAPTAAGRGFIIVSSQGNSTFTVYRREAENTYVGAFRLLAGAGIDQVTGTDGIDVTTQPLGPLFPRGVFVAQDFENDSGNQNFKLVPWERIDPDAARPQSGSLLAEANAVAAD